MRRFIYYSISIIIVASVWAWFLGFKPADILQYFPKYDQVVSIENNGHRKSSTKEPSKRSSSKSDRSDKDRAKKISNKTGSKDFAKIDKFARNTPNSVSRDVSKLARYLGQNLNNDTEKARAIFSWITHHIRYNDAAYNTGTYGDNSAEYVLQSRKAVCEGFSNLFQALGKEMNLEVVKVPGYAKGAEFSASRRKSKPDHVWNMVKLDGDWKHIDVTWGEGVASIKNGKLSSKKRFDPYWFDVESYEFIFSHYPAESKWLRVSPGLSRKQFEKLPMIKRQYFSMGFEAKTVYQKSMLGQYNGIPVCRNVDVAITMNDAPPTKELRQDGVYFFDFTIPKAKEVAIRTADQEWVMFSKKKDRFYLEYLANQEGELHVFVQYASGGSAYHSFLEYQVSQDSQNDI